MSWSYSAAVGPELARPAPVYLGTGPEDIICLEKDLGVAFIGAEASAVELEPDQVKLLSYIAANACRDIQFVQGRHKTIDALDEARQRVQRLREALGAAGSRCIQVESRLTYRGINTLTWLPRGYMRPVSLASDVIYKPLKGQLVNAGGTQRIDSNRDRFLLNLLLAHHTQPLPSEYLASQLETTNGALRLRMLRLRDRLASVGAPDCIKVTHHAGYYLQ